MRRTFARSPFGTARCATLLLALSTGCATFAQGAGGPAPGASAPAAAPARAASAAAPAAQPEAKPAAVLPPVRASAAAEPAGKDAVQAQTTRIGKGQQDLRDLPQSLTVVTERLIDDRMLDTLKDVLRNTSGISRLAAEGGEEDIRLRGFALQTTGDIFVDGMRDPAFYDRDTFFLDRVEVLRGSASLLFGRGSTGGAVNQVTKQAWLLDENQIDVTLGSHGALRTLGDFNLRLGESSGLRLGVMATEADNDGAGSAISKRGAALAWRSGVGERHEFSATLYHLDNDNGINYGLPYIRPTPTSDVATTGLLPLDPTTRYAMASDRNHSDATTLTLGHRWRIAQGTELTTRVRHGAFERDQRASTIRFAAAAAQPGGQAVSLATFGPGTVLTRGTQLKIQSLDTLQAQSDLASRFGAGGFKHEVQAGIDLARERKTVRAARNAAQGGVVPPKPTTTVGAPDDGAWIDEDSRVLRTANRYESLAGGMYAQDLIEVVPHWKVLLGLRYDRLVGDYDTFALPAAAAGPETITSYRMKVAEWSRRAALLYQPSERFSFHLGGATSFNTSGDAYSLSAANVDVPPEQSINVELGARAESADGNFSGRVAVFRSTKLHERNTDPLVNLVTLSGKRHAAGLEVDLAGRLAPTWEVFGSYMWMPVAVIDEGVAGAEGQGTRPSLTPVHTGTLWTAWQATQVLRLGAGLNARSGMQPLRNPGFYVPRYVVGDLMLEYQLIYQKLIFKLNVNNVTNKLYADSVYTGHYVPGPGRLTLLTGTYKF